VWLRIPALIGVLLVCLGLAGCGETASQREVRDTVTRFYAALKAHDAGTVCRLVSPAFAQALLRGSTAAGKPCEEGLRLVFRGARPHEFDSLPHVVATTANGNQGTAVVARGYQRRRLSLTRVGTGWRLSGP
jgi:hypothetical protein